MLCVDQQHAFTSFLCLFFVGTLGLSLAYSNSAFMDFAALRRNAMQMVSRWNANASIRIASSFRCQHQLTVPSYAGPAFAVTGLFDIKLVAQTYTRPSHKTSAFWTSS